MTVPHAHGEHLARMSAVEIMHSHVQNEAQKSSIESWMRLQEKKTKEKILEMIVDEILICHHENTPTSRLTSLANKIYGDKWSDRFKSWTKK